MRPSCLFLGMTLLSPALVACSETGLNSRLEPDPPGDTDQPDAPPPYGDPDQPAVEICDGIDNDGDGVVDEGFPDIDGDGRADCVDRSCELVEAEPRSELDEECTGGLTIGDPPARPWDVTIEWRWTDGPVYSTPTVGDIDADGTPEVVFTYGCPSFFEGCLAVVDGVTGRTEFTISGVDGSGGVALGDLDGDGDGEIVTYRYTPREVVAFDHRGTELWTVPYSGNVENYPAIADLEGDGTVEVIANALILDGPTGRVEASLSGVAGPWGAPAVADMDGDGVQEVMIENRVHAADGTFLWSCGGYAGIGSFPQPVNIDADPEGELFVTASGKATLCDDDGRVLWTRDSRPYGTATAVADFDDDGVQEFAFANYGSVALLEPDGSTRWTTAIKDYSGLAGTTSWDIDLDGVPEVVYGDEDDILVLDGATGAVVIRDANHGSVTLAETPAVADVDGDLQGELIFGSNSGYSGVTVFGGADGDWPFSPPVYNQYSYYGANVGSDLSIPPTPPAPWMTEANLFRGQPSALFVAGAPNLRVDITDVCVASCEPNGAVEIALVVWNDGGVRVPDGTPLVLFGDDGSGPRPFHEALLPEIPAEASVELVVIGTTAQVGEVITASVDGGEAIDECIEEDNQDSYGDLPCP